MALISTFPSLPVTWECTFAFEAWKTDWSGQVSDVVIRDPVLYGLNLTGQTSAQVAAAPVGPFMLVPGPQS